MKDKALVRIRSWIASSGLGKGGRLPPERELCDTLGISRSELRKALLVLETEGVLDRHVGRGTFLATVSRPARGDSGIDRAVADLSETTGPVDAMQTRLLIEPEIARLAALNATPAQLRRLRQLTEDMRTAGNWTNYEALDSEFHHSIAAACGNGLMQAMHSILNGVRQVVVWRRLDTSDRGPEPGYHSFDEHDAILTALEHRDAAAAAVAMRAHLESTLTQLTRPHSV